MAIWGYFTVAQPTTRQTFTITSNEFSDAQTHITTTLSLQESEILGGFTLPGTSVVLIEATETSARLLTGTSDPANSVGNDGDSFFNTTSLTYFGPKANGAWPAGRSLQGTPGAPGAPGTSDTATIQNVIAQTVMGNSEVGGTLTWDDTNKKIDLRVGPTFMAPVIDNFAVDVASRINLNTDINGSRTLTFDLQHATNLSTLDLYIDNTLDQSLTVPLNDGPQTIAVTISGQDTSTAKTITFELRGTDTNSDAITPASYAVEVRNLSSTELLYYGTSSTNNFTTIDVTTLNNVETASGGTHIIATGVVNQGDFFGILVRNNHTLTDIVDDVLQQSVLNIFTKTANARTIDSVSYDLFVIGPLNADANGESYTITQATT